jgi:hypothetical protein
MVYFYGALPQKKRPLIVVVFAVPTKRDQAFLSCNSEYKADMILLPNSECYSMHLTILGLSSSLM